VIGFDQIAAERDELQDEVRRLRDTEGNGSKAWAELNGLDCEAVVTYAACELEVSPLGFLAPDRAIAVAFLLGVKIGRKIATGDLPT
jgi:hypothetical protein